MLISLHTDSTYEMRRLRCPAPTTPLVKADKSPICVLLVTFLPNPESPSITPNEEGTKAYPAGRETRP
jgi:hypothetical protein